MLSGMVKEEEKEALRTDLIGLAAEYAPTSIIGSGGNINKLFRLADKKDKKASLLPVESLREIYEALQALPAEQRIKQYKLKPDRADVIVPAAEIFLEVAMNVKATKSLYLPSDCPTEYRQPVHSEDEYTCRTKGSINR